MIYLFSVPRFLRSLGVWTFTIHHQHHAGSIIRHPFIVSFRSCVYSIVSPSLCLVVLVLACLLSRNRSFAIYVRLGVLSLVCVFYQSHSLRMFLFYLLLSHPTVAQPHSCTPACTSVHTYPIDASSAPMRPHSVKRSLHLAWTLGDIEMSPAQENIDHCASTSVVLSVWCSSYALERRIGYVKVPASSRNRRLFSCNITTTCLQRRMLVQHPCWAFTLQKHPSSSKNPFEPLLHR